jgi:KDO2-lipid IV(A) lauroyltransferase
MSRRGDRETPTLRHRVEYAAYRLVRGVIRLLPHGAARWPGRRLGELAWAIDGRHRRVARENLAAALPDLDRRRRGRLVRDCFRHFGAMLLDVLSASRLDLVGLCRRLTIEGWEHVLAAQQQGRGILFITAHLGAWEIAADALGTYAGQLHVVGRPLDNPLLDRELGRLRGRFGNRLLAKRGALRGLVRVLGAGENAGLLIDQRPGPRQGIEVPFFGRPAATTPAVASLSLRFGAPVVPVHVYPEPGGRYRLLVRPPILPDQAGGLEGDRAVAALTARYTAELEEEIRRLPEQWLWMHRRWRGSGPVRNA